MDGPLAGKTIAVVGAGPAGATAASLLARSGQPRVLLFEPRPLLHPPQPGGKIPACGGCGGLVQASVLSRLKDIGLILGPPVIQAHLDGYVVHYVKTKSIFEIPSSGMVAVYRGWGPVRSDMPKESFDSSLARFACAAGAEFHEEQVTSIRLGNGTSTQATIVTDKGMYHADFVIGAFGHNHALFDHILGPGLTPAPLDVPRIVRGAVREYDFGDTFVEQAYHHQVHIISDPTPNIWFAALIPKRGVVTIVLMGHSDTKPSDFDELFALRSLRHLLPSQDPRLCLKCGCTRTTLTVSSPRRFLISGTGGIALIGDAGPTRPRKNGLLAAIDLAEKLALCLQEDGFDQRALRRFSRHALINYVIDDIWAERTLAFSGTATRIPMIGSLTARALTRGRHLPIVTPAMQEYARLMLTGEGPYWRIPFAVMRRMFRT